MGAPVKNHSSVQERMMDSPDISVVIPAYQSEQFIEACIRSVLQHDCVKQVVVADDASTDDTAAIIQRLAEEDQRVEYTTHADGKNKGAGPTRNMAIGVCRYAWIAFLDADDLWLPERFDQTFSVLHAYPDADGVYECLGIQFDTEEAEQQWMERHGYTLTTLQERVEPESLIFSMAPLGNKGWFSGDALLVKRTMLEVCGGYSDLRLSQDTELFMKLAVKGRLYPGNINTPVALRRVHGNNRITTSPERFYAHRLILWKQFSDWCLQEKLHGKLLQKVWLMRIHDILVYVRWVPGNLARFIFTWRSLRPMLHPRWLKTFF